MDIWLLVTPLWGYYTLLPVAWLTGVLYVSSHSVSAQGLAGWRERPVLLGRGTDSGCWEEDVGPGPELREGARYTGCESQFCALQVLCKGFNSSDFGLLICKDGDDPGRALRVQGTLSGAWCLWAQCLPSRTWSLSSWLLVRPLLHWAILGGRLGLQVTY